LAQLGLPVAKDHLGLKVTEVKEAHVARPVHPEKEVIEGVSAQKALPVLPVYQGQLGHPEDHPGLRGQQGLRGRLAQTVHKANRAQQVLRAQWDHRVNLAYRAQSAHPGHKALKARWDRKVISVRPVNRVHRGRRGHRGLRVAQLVRRDRQEMLGALEQLVTLAQLVTLERRVQRVQPDRQGQLDRKEILEVQAQLDR
jgi:hypothetical protein